MKLKKLNNWSLPIILLISIANHLFTFFAYTWYAGMDSYSYDVCGLQLVSGYKIDIFSLMYRPPLVPILKNILYLIFEGHPFALSIFVHFIGVITTVLVYRLGCKFNKKIGFIDIYKLIKQMMDTHEVINNPTIEQILNADKIVKQEARKIVENGL